MSLLDETKSRFSRLIVQSAYWRIVWTEDGVAFLNANGELPELEEYDELMAQVKRFYQYAVSQYGSRAAFNQWLRESRELEREEARAASNVKQGKRIEPTPGYVYLLHSNGVYKIGHAKDLTRRMMQISPVMPHEVELVHAIKCENMVGLESELHQQFADKRLNGEWFNLSAEDVEYIKHL